MMLNAALKHLGLAVDLQKLDEPLKQIGDGIDAMTMRAFDCAATTDDDDQILTSRDFVFIQECITGEPLPEVEAIWGPGLHGRTAEHQEWLYDIVHNRHSGLDVDKVDYYARDGRRALRESGEIDELVIANAVVAWGKCTEPGGSCERCRRGQGKKHDRKHLMICYPEKMVGSVSNFFRTRFSLHNTIYQHKTTVAVALMIDDILCLADPYFLIPTGSLAETSVARSGGAVECDALPISRVMCHPGAYLRMKDWIIGQISMTTDPNLAEARKLIHRLNCRDLYKCIDSKQLLCHKKNEKHQAIWAKSEAEITQEILRIPGVHTDPDSGEEIKAGPDDIIVLKCTSHHGQKERNPLTRCRFVEKAKLNLVTAANYLDLPEANPVDKDHCDAFLPSTLQLCTLRVYCRDSYKCGIVSHLFSQYLPELNSEMEQTVQKRERPHGISQDSGDEGGGVYSDDSDDYPPTPEHRGNEGTPSNITPMRGNNMP